MDRKKTLPHKNIRERMRWQIQQKFKTMKMFVKNSNFLIMRKIFGMASLAHTNLQRHLRMRHLRVDTCAWTFVHRHLRIYRVFQVKCPYFILP
jgi:hypothetical protein